MENMIMKLQKYIEDILGYVMVIMPIPKQELGNLPMYINEIYNLHRVTLGDIHFVLIEYKDVDAFSISQLEKHSELINTNLNQKVVLLAKDISALYRKRLIEKGINFIVPDKQLFLPEFLMDLREVNQNAGRKKKTEKLLPSAQFILIYHLLQRPNTGHIGNDSFTQLALRFGYTKMAITKAVDNLDYLGLCEVEGTKEKYIRFASDKGQLWHLALPLLVNPVLKIIYVDEMPEGMHLLKANESALPEYSDMNPSQQKYYAIEKGKFYDLKKNGQLKNPNEHEGKYGLEVWKYNPEPLVEILNINMSVVDPLSLYLSLKENRDERIEMALEQILEHFLW
ncbi:MAG TPA: hypothetical protein VFC65_07495 [Prolixibacteraceae bacterium]|nr:hypothetical protein [Prolixibacteraceae bacterium]